jgi:hypothetical protein
MDEKIVQEVLHQLFSSLEALDTQSAAVLQFMKDKGLVNDEEFRPYLERAGNASGVRWLAARVRIDHLLAGAMKAAEEEDAAKQASKATESSQQTSSPDKPADKSTDSPESKPGKQEEKPSAQAPVSAESPSASSDEAPKEPQQKGKESKEDQNPKRSAA